MSRAERPPPSRALLLVAGGALAATALSVLVVDAWVATTIAQYEPAALWNDIIAKLEWLVLLPTLPWMLPIVLAVAMLASIVVRPWNRAAYVLMFLCGSHVLGRALTNYLKDWTGRLRPLQWIEAGAPDGALGSFLWEKGIAFPSGHVSIFASVIVPIVVLVPRLWPLLGIVVYVMAARVAVDAHWVSDTLGSIALVALITWACAWAIRPQRRA